jgi:prespore-specific regulator
VIKDRGDSLEEKKRKDSWTVEDDKVLADIVLTFIREGKTQVQAFSEASSSLGRTQQACGFRWNKTLRKDYQIQKIKRRPQSDDIHSHLNHAMMSYDKLTIAYETLKVDYEQLKSQQDKIIHWFANGKEIIMK